MAVFTTRTLDDLRKAFRDGYMSVRTDVSLARQATEGSVGEMVARMLHTAQQGAQHIAEQWAPNEGMDGVRLSELQELHGVTLPGARRARAAVLIVSTSPGGSTEFLNSGASFTVGDKTFELVSKVDWAVSTLGYATTLRAGAKARTLRSGYETLWHFSPDGAGSEGFYPVELLPRWSVLENDSGASELMVVRRSFWGSRGTVEVYPVFPRGYVEPDVATTWSTINSAIVVEFEATDTGFADIVEGQKLSLDAEEDELEAWVIEADAGGEELSENDYLVGLLRGQVAGEAASHNAQWYRELVINNPDVAVRDAYVYPSSRGLGSFDIVPIPQSGREVPEISAKRLHDYVRSQCPEDDDPRVVECVRSREVYVPYVIDVTVGGEHTPDPVGSIGGSDFGIGVVQVVATAVTGERVYCYVPGYNTIGDDWNEFSGSRMVLMTCDQDDNVNIGVVEFVAHFSGADFLVCRTLGTEFSSISGSDADITGWLFRYSDILPSLYDVLQPGFAWPATDPDGAGGARELSLYGTRVKKEMFVSATGIATVPCNTVENGWSTGAAVDAALGYYNAVDQPVIPKALFAWPPDSDHVYRDQLTAAVRGVDGVQDARINPQPQQLAVKPLEMSQLDPGDYPALNTYELPDVRVLINLLSP